ncbi:MAG: STAS domain-containing protein [Comamonas sp.]
MSTDDSKPGGLFSKVVRFVRHPTAHWADADAPDDPLNQVDRQVLRQTLERKRRNDFVRQREFEQLRRLRQKQAAGVGESQVEASSQSSSVQSSLMLSDARAVTLQKIDAIEEQMSQQWWRNRQPADASTMPMYLLSTFPQPDSVHVAAAASGPAPGPTGFVPTAPLDWNVDNGDAHAPEPAAAPVPEGAASSTTFATTVPLDSPPWDALAMADGPFVHDPDFEEAAIAFANGDAAGAETLLLALMMQRTAQPEVQYPVWLALFDLYRAAGLAERFEVLAIDFAAHFGRSAPLWFAFSTPGVVAPDFAMGTSEENAHDWRWTAPPVLTRASVAALQRAKAAAPAPWTLFWSALERIEADAVAPLERVFAEWAQAPGLLVFLDAPVLAQCLQALTLSGERQAPEDGWLLRMAALRLMEQHDSFELVALDYCVTYEVSPPSWAPPLSRYSEGIGDVLPAAAEPLARPLPARAGLAGCIDGDATPWLVPLEDHARPGLPLVVDCAELIRMDFAAAGSLLNWAARMQAQGVALRLERLHQLVAVFFGMVGVGEYAQLVARSD